jgi:hypothetical protein
MKIPNLFFDPEPIKSLDGLGWVVGSIGIVDDERDVYHQIIDPGFPLNGAYDHKGLTDALIAKEGKTLEEVVPELQHILHGARLIGWNLEEDRKLFSDRLGSATELHCAMKRFAAFNAEYNPRFDDYQYKKLEEAANSTGCIWDGARHTALGDARMTRSIWQWMEDCCETRKTEAHLVTRLPDSWRTQHNEEPALRLVTDGSDAAPF